MLRALISAFFCQFSAKKLEFFPKCFPKVMINFLHYLALFWVKTPIFGSILGANIFLKHNIGPLSPPQTLLSVPAPWPSALAALPALQSLKRAAAAGDEAGAEIAAAANRYRSTQYSILCTSVKTGRETSSRIRVWSLICNVWFTWTAKIGPIFAIQPTKIEQFL
jgi:hypothetical protein